MKKIKYFVLSLIIMFSVFPITGFASTEFDDEIAGELFISTNSHEHDDNMSIEAIASSCICSGVAIIKITPNFPCGYGGYCTGTVTLYEINCPWHGAGVQRSKCNKCNN